MGRPAVKRRRDRLIVLDRDGVINADSADYIKSAAEWHPLPGSLEAIARLNAAGYDVVVVTNQSGIGRGLFDADALAEIHAAMRAATAAAGGDIAGIYVCPHRPDEGCDCRKPMPGLLRRIEADFDRPLAGVPLIGDKLSDVLAARAVGARPVFVRSGGREDDAARAAGLGAGVHPDLAAAVDALLAEQGN
ncbi:MAG: D-glycero-beta-D-manno-heptose 1,7-bisphosphate 7-phosphatase [Gammaproteobacteria bacterium]|nr:D-glycero-beta-D-manno-heptose 1,7-bisphosphate 7-phosphatase [Gammaproteobacteria bacterium]